MEIADKSRIRNPYSSATRVYSPSRSSVAYAYEQAIPLPRRQEKQDAQHRQRLQPKEKLLSSGCKWALLLAMAVIAASSLVIVSRFANIAGSYAQINKLKAAINEAELRIRELNVSLECAVSIEDAKEAASRLGMAYPDASQYVRVGEPFDAKTTVQTGGAKEPEGA